MKNIILENGPIKAQEFRERSNQGPGIQRTVQSRPRNSENGPIKAQEFRERSNQGPGIHKLKSGERMILFKAKIKLKCPRARNSSY